MIRTKELKCGKNPTRFEWRVQQSVSQDAQVSKGATLRNFNIKERKSDSECEVCWVKNGAGENFGIKIS